MPEEATVLPPSRIVRWLTIGVLIGIAVAMYFRAGTRLPPLTGAVEGPGGAGGAGGAPAADSTN